MDRRQKLDIYANAYQELTDFLETVTDAELEYKPSPEKWSGHEILVHIADSEANSYVRLRRALAEPGGQVLGYDQDTWTKNLDYQHQDYTGYIELFKLLRQMNYELVKDMPEENWNRYYNHSEYGKVDMNQWLDTYINHVTGHIKQIRRNIAEMKGESK